MTQKTQPYNRNNHGFTLIEVIIAIILAALLGTMIIQYTGTNLRSTVESLVATHNNTEAVSVMEQITRDYRNWLEEHPDEDISAFQNMAETYSDVQAQIITLQGDDPADSILRVTVTKGNRKLVSLFTK